MHNIRKLKKKKKVRPVNPEEVATQKLFEISIYHDEDYQKIE